MKSSKKHSSSDHDSSAKQQGGYHCKLARQPSKTLLVHCPACQRILRAPCQVTCCGQSFCQSCVEAFSNNSCSNCGMGPGNFNAFTNEALEKELGKLEVYCPYQHEGCKWTGKLKKLDKHLGEEKRGGEEEREGGSNPKACPYSRVKCQVCGKTVRREELSLHATEKCLKRAYQCQYCGEYKSTFEDVMTNHRPLCKYSPTPCPSCGEMVMFLDLDSHMRNDCPQRVLKCEFRAFGCTASMTRGEMSEHLLTRTSMHMGMLAKALTKVSLRLDELTAESQREIARLKEENIYLIQRLEEEHQQDSVVRPRRAPVLEERDLACGRDEADSPAHLLKVAEFTMENFAQYKRENKEWFSPPFYTSQKGYRMCLEVLANGQGSTRGQYVAVYSYLMRGEFDDVLEWPFLGELVIELVDQESARYHAQSIRYTKVTPMKYASKVLKTERSMFGKGVPNFIHLSELPNKFLKEDCLVFRILRNRQPKP